MNGFNKSVAVVIGINDYSGGINPLTNARKDAETISDILRKDHDYEVTLLIDREATRANILTELRDTLPQQVSDADRLLLYFAGHGQAETGEDGPQGYLIPQDARHGDPGTYLPMTEVLAALDKLKCKHFLGILDCCFAGAIRWASSRDLGKAPQVIHRERYERFIRDPAWQVITSAGSKQKAADGHAINTERGQKGVHSPFAAALISGLKGVADAFPKSTNGHPSGDGVITANELYIYLRDVVEPAADENQQPQTPGLWHLKKHDQGEYIFLTPGHALNLPPAPPLDPTSNPYRGLESYEEMHSEFFFGRAEQRQKLLEFVQEHPLTVVLGASGSGKSSLVKAGLIPGLKERKGEKWLILKPIRPGERPWQALDQTLNESGVPVVENSQAGTLSSRIGAWTRSHPDQTILLVIDQAEEMVTLCRNKEKRQGIIGQLVEAIHAHRDRFRVVLSLRSDYEPQVRDSGFASAFGNGGCSDAVSNDDWQRGRFLMSPMTREELREAIEKPADAKVMIFEPHELVDTLVDEVADTPGALPLLSFALSELYLKYLKRQQDANNAGEIIDRSMTRADYDELGGVRGALTQRANLEYDQLKAQDAAYPPIIRQVMLRMVALGGGEVARRRVPLSELFYSGNKDTLAQEVLRCYTNARLLVQGTDSSETSYVEPAHDALMRGWQKLAEWRQEEVESLPLQRRLTPAAEEWNRMRTKVKRYPIGILQRLYYIFHWIDQNCWFPVESRMGQILTQSLRVLPRARNQHGQSTENPVEYLWSTNPYLNVLDAELKSNDHWLNQVEAEFVRQSVLTKRQNISWRWRIAIIAMMILSGLTIWALKGLRDTQIAQIQNLRQSAEVKRQSNQELEGLLDVLEAGKLLDSRLLSLFRPDAEIEQLEKTLPKVVYTVRQLNRLDGRRGPVMAVDFQSTPDREMIVTKDSEGIAVWSLDGKLEKKYTFDEVNAIFNQSDGDLYKTLGQKSLLPVSNFSPDGKMFADLGDGGKVNLWNSNWTLHKTFQAHNRQAMTVRFSPDSQMIATGSWDTEVRIWKLDGTLYKTLEGHTGPVAALDFSRDGQIIASASSDKTVKLWSRDGTLLKTLEGHKGEVWGVSISPDSQMIASASADGTVKLWNRDGTLLKTLEGHRDTVRAVRFSADGHILASASDDETVILWKLGGTPLTILDGYTDVVYTVRFNPDGKTVATTSGQGYITLWQKDGTLLKPAEQWDQYGPITALEFSPDGDLVVSGAGDRTVRLSRSNGSRIKLLEGHTGETQLKEVQAVSFSPDSQIFAIGDVDGKIEVWNRGGSLRKSFNAHNRTVSGLSFSPDGQIFASASWDGAVKLWNKDGSLRQTLRDHGSSLFGVAFSPDKQPDDQIIAAASEDRTVKLWKRDGTELEPLKGHRKRVHAVAFSPNGQLIATASYDSTVRLWKRDGTLLKTFYGHNDQVNAVAFSPDGKRLASASNDKTVHLWDVNLDADIAGIRSYACRWMHDNLQNSSHFQNQYYSACDGIRDYRHEQHSLLPAAYSKLRE